jgi:solute carrier family 35 protein E1
MSPLFTVAAYRLLFHIQYSTATYISLIPLTFGVMLACSVEFRGNFFGVLMAFAGAIIFVTQNIVSKKLFNESSMASDPSIPVHRRKLDKLNLLCYSSGQAFLLTIPLWLYYEGFGLAREYADTGSVALQKEGKHGKALSERELVGEFFFNGTVHFGQNIIAFVLLSMVSPVTYSVASLVKRIFVILMAIAWFGSSTTNVQAVGIALTFESTPSMFYHGKLISAGGIHRFLGLYLYDRAGDTSRKEKALKAQQLKDVQPLLPLNEVHTVAGSSSSYIDSPKSKKAMNEITDMNVYRQSENASPRTLPPLLSSSTWLPSGVK